VAAKALLAEHPEAGKDQSRLEYCRSQILRMTRSQLGVLRYPPPAQQGTGHGRHVARRCLECNGPASGAACVPVAAKAVLVEHPEARKDQSRLEYRRSQILRMPGSQLGVLRYPPPAQQGTGHGRHMAQRSCNHNERPLYTVM
jgi:hypothetical protein